MTPWMFAFVLLLSAMLLCGDYLIKRSVTSPRPVLCLALAAAFWVATIPGWRATVMDNRLAIVGMLFSVASILGTVLIGMVFFDEKLSPAEWTGFALGVASALLLAGKT